MHTLILIVWHFSRNTGTELDNTAKPILYHPNLNTDEKNNESLTNRLNEITA